MTSRPILLALLASSAGLVAGPVLADAPFGFELEIVALSGANNVCAGALDGAPGADIFAGAESPASLVVAIQEAGGTWSETSLLPASGSRAVELGDLDGDGDLDLVYTDFVGDRLYWRPNDLDVSGTFLARQEIAIADGAQGAAVGDVDGDGDLDLLLAGRVVDAYLWIENVAGDGMSWTPHLIDSVNAAQAVWGGDVDGDGDLDMVGGSAAVGELSWYENTEGDGSAWTKHNLISETNFTAVGGADLDHDGDLDLLVQEQGVVPELRWWENTPGEVPAWTAHSIASVTSTGRGLQAVDLDFDGDLDVVGSRDGKWYENAAGDASTWTEREFSALTDDLADTDAVDIDGDGDIDIVAARVDLGVVSWWPNLTCSPGDPDPDDDGAIGGCDICEGFDDEQDADGDGVPDGCDICPAGDDNMDADHDGNPDACQGVTIDDVTVDEGDTGTTALTFTITLGGNTDAFTLGYSLADTTATVYEDYGATSGTIDFAGENGEAHAVTVFGFGDTMVEDDESFTVELTLESGTVDLVDPTAVGTLLNDDLAAISIDDVSLDEGDSGTAAFTFTLTLSADLEDSLEVDYATQAITATAGSDYVGHTGSVTFAGHAFEQQAVTVLVKGDEAAEDDETFHLDLASDHVSVLTDDTGVGTILDDDTVRLLVDSPSVIEGSSGSVDLVFTLELTNDTTPFDVDYETVGDSADDEDYEAVTDTVSFSGAAGETHTIMVAVNGDLVVEGNETFSLHLAPSDPEVLAEDATGTLLDDDSATVAIDDVAMAEGDSGTTDFVFTVSLTGAVQDSFDVSYQTIAQTATAGSDYVATSGSLSLGNASSSDILTVVVQGDTLAEPDEQLVVEIFGTLPEGVTFADGLGNGLILDDDVVLTLTVDGTGHVGSSPAGIDCGNGGLDCEELYAIDTVVDLIATPETGWVFVGFTGDADCADGSVTLSGAVACIATFVLDQGTLEVSFEGDGLGVVTSNPPGIDCDSDGNPSDCTAGFDTGAEVSLGFSLTDPDSIFVGWTGDADCIDAVVTFDAPGETVHCVAIVQRTLVFIDGFESGDTSSWSVTVP